MSTVEKPGSTPSPTTSQGQVLAAQYFYCAGHALSAHHPDEKDRTGTFSFAAAFVEITTRTFKKNIQPHFIKNTLTSLIDWVEESPKKGTEFIQALANEFDIMNAISEQSLIPIRQEIALCQMHLKVMGFRKEINYEWEDNGIITSATIPPAIFHTLLENGITHNTPQDNGIIRFKLSFTQNDDFCQYTFETFGKNRELQADRSGGNGFRYIKARLEESYPGYWQFSSTASPQGWTSIIKISNKLK